MFALNLPEESPFFVDNAKDIAMSVHKETILIAVLDSSLAQRIQTAYHAVCRESPVSTQSATISTKTPCQIRKQTGR